MSTKIDWPEAIKPLLKKYKGKKHPLDYGNTYQLLVGVILSAQDSDLHINQLSPKLFEAFPDMKALSMATEETLFPFIGSVRNYANKTKWLIALALKIKKDSNIPLTLDELTALPGIGRKSANEWHPGLIRKRLRSRLWKRCCKKNGTPVWRCPSWGEKYAAPSQNAKYA